MIDVCKKSEKYMKDLIAIADNLEECRCNIYKSKVPEWEKDNQKNR